MGDQRLYPCYALSEHAHSGYSIGNLLERATNGLQLRSFLAQLLPDLGRRRRKLPPVGHRVLAGVQKLYEPFRFGDRLLKYSRSAGDVITLVTALGLCPVATAERFADFMFTR